MCQDFAVVVLRKWKVHIQRHAATGVVDIELTDHWKKEHKALLITVKTASQLFAILALIKTLRIAAKRCLI